MKATDLIFNCNGKATCQNILAKPFIFSSYLNLFKCTTKYLGKVFKRVRFYASCFELHF